MPENYKEAVFAAYNERKKSGTLSPNLLMPTPGDIREECIKIYHERPSIEDDKIIKLFFSVNDNDKGCINILNNSYAYNFKQVPKILKENGPEPGIRFVELLAWLIDFQPRPSTLYYNTFDQVIKEDDVEDIKKTDNIEPKNNSDTMDKPNNDPPIYKEQEEVQLEQIKKKDRPSFLNIFLIAIAFLLIEAGAIFLWRNYSDRIAVPTPDKKCMYWTGTHYEPINCGQINGDVPVIPLDIKKLNNLKRIDISDTLTQKSLGKVWYSNVDKKHEFFTDSGMHPIDTVKRLRPLTSYILTKYTSNHRFLLNVITLVCGSIVVAILFAFGVDYLIRKQRNKHIVKTD